MGFSNWYSASRCTSARPGSKALMAVLLDEYSGASNWGIYSCRPPSLHAEGRALDLGCSITVGRRIVKALLKADPSELGISSIIHDQTIYSAKSPKGRRMSNRGSVTANHKDHVHIGLTRSAAENLTKAKVRRVLGSGSGIDYDAYAKHVQPGERVLSLGSAGDDVRFVQKFIGKSKAGKADGYFGPKTQAGVRWYQDMRGIAVDGVVGPQTWGEMDVR